MRLKISLLTLILLMPLFSAAAQEPGWLVSLKRQKWMRSIAALKVLKTTRFEAEKILGKAENSNPDSNKSIEYYSINNDRVVLRYTTKECTSTDGKIAKDTIKNVSFYLNKSIPLSSLKLPLNQFSHFRENDNPTEHYWSEQTGIDIAVQNNKAFSIDFDIPKRMDFSCVTVSTFLKDLDKIRKLKMLESNRDEVRKIFAGYEKLNDPAKAEYKDTYYTDNALIKFSYSQGKCRFDDPDEYGSDEWNIEGVNIRPNNLIYPKEFGIDLTKYKKERMYKNNLDFYFYYDKSLGISFQILRDRIAEINFFPPQKYYSLMCDREQAKVLSSTESLFTEKLKDRIFNISAAASVKKVNLSMREINTGCDYSDSAQNKNCLIDVLTKVNNPVGDVLTYSYKVSGGKIIGIGEKVVWDLSGVKAGVYKITATVDDGCGFCGKSASNTVTVKECTDCFQKQ